MSLPLLIGPLLSFFVSWNHITLQMELHLSVEEMAATWQGHRLITPYRTLEGQTVWGEITAATG